MKIRQQLRFYGSVQGVGFRFTAKHLATLLEVTGWVYNDYDGSVLMQAQGTKEKIDTLIERLQDDRFIFIDRIEKENIPLEENEFHFHIKD